MRFIEMKIETTYSKRQRNFEKVTLKFSSYSTNSSMKRTDKHLLKNGKIDLTAVSILVLESKNLN